MDKTKSCNKKLHKKLWLIAAIITAVFICSITFISEANKKSYLSFLSGHSKNNKNNDTSVKRVTKKYNLNNFNKVSMGMTYNDVVKILGNYTSKTSSNGENSSDVNYTWQNVDSSNISVMFENGKVINKSQASLESMNANVTIDKYNKISKRMTYENVRKILGEGQLTSEGKIFNINSKLYQWINADGSNLNILFENGKVLNKSQKNLKVN